MFLPIPHNSNFLEDISGMHERAHSEHEKKELQNGTVYANNPKDM